MVIDGGGGTVELIILKKIHDNPSRYVHVCQMSSMSWEIFMLKQSD
jgi:hypothetical protein